MEHLRLAFDMMLIRKPVTPVPQPHVSASIKFCFLSSTCNIRSNFCSLSSNNSEHEITLGIRDSRKGGSEGVSKRLVALSDKNNFFASLVLDIALVLIKIYLG